MKFKIKSYTGTVHTKRPILKLSSFLRFIPKYTDVHIRVIVNPDSKFASEIQDFIISPVNHLNIRSLSNYVVDCVSSCLDEFGDYLLIVVYDQDHDLPF